MADYFYNPTIQNIAMVKNDTMSFGFQLQGLEGQTPTEIYFTVKDNPSDTAFLFQRVIGNGVDLKEYDPVSDTYTYTVRIAPEDTENIEIGRYFYDLEIHCNKDTYTLLKGVLSIDWEVTAKINEDPTPGDDGDNKYYPVGDPEGKLKYTELYISDIAQGILDINDAETTYRVSDMVSALAAIRSELNDISDAINSKTGGSGLIPLANMAAQINSIIVGASHLDIIDISIRIVKDIQGSSYANGYFIFYPDNTHYVLVPTRALPNIALAFFLARGSLKLRVGIQTYDQGSDYNTNLFTVGKNIYEPWFYSDYTSKNSPFPGFSTYNLVDDLPFKNMLFKAVNPDTSRLHPLIPANLGFTFQSLDNNLKFTDLFDPTALKAYIGSTPIVGVLVFRRYLSNTDFGIMVVTTQAGLPVYNTVNEAIGNTTGYYTEGSISYRYTKISLSTAYNTGYNSSVSLQELPDYIVFNTVDIKDQNDNVVLQANATLEDFGLD